MRMNREEFVRKYSTIFFEFDFSGCTELEYDHEIYDLTDGARLEELIRRSKEKKDYPVCKIANNILAVYEVENQTVHYRHTPVMMHIELSSFCDCECIMCRHCYEKNSSAKYLPRKSFYELAPYFAACRIVIINGYGEPFIHPHIAEIISAFEKYGIRLFTTTNIQHLPPGGPDQTNKVFARINVSCDGATAETYESIRRGASFDTFVKNVKILRGQCPDVQLFMSVVAMRQNIGEAVELVRLAKELGFEEIRFGRLGSNLFLGNEIGAPSATLYRACGAAFDERSNWASDMFLYFEILQKNPRFAFTPEPLISIGVHEEQYTESFTEKDIRKYQDRLLMYEKYGLKAQEDCRKEMLRLTVMYGQGWKTASACGASLGEYLKQRAVWFWHNTVLGYWNGLLHKLGLKR